MGADIYLRSKNNAARAKWKPLFNAAVAERDAATTKAERKAAQAKVEEAYEGMHAEGYFRDSYNSSALFGVVGASWWQLGNEVLNKKSELPFTRAKKLLARFEAGDFTLTREKFEVWAKANQEDWEGGRIDFTTEGNSKEEWWQYFTEKHARWCQLLRDSIAMKEPLYWSI